MKKVIWSLVFGLWSLAALAQGTAAVVTKDTTFQTTSGGNVFETRRVEYSTGEFSENKRLIGDLNTVFSNYYNAFVREGERMATLAFEARDFDKITRGMIQRNDSILTLTGKDLLDTLTARYAGPLRDSTGWQVFEDTLKTNVSFSVNAGGQLRYQIAGFPVRTASIISNTMRLNNYKATGKPLDLYRAPGGNWFSIDDRVRVKYPGNKGLR